MPSKKSRKKKIIIFLLIAVILIILFWAGLAVSSQPRFCNNCHIMNKFYYSWKSSKHNIKADCLDCHSDPGFIGELKAHLNGVKYIYVLIGKGKNLNYKYIRATVPSSRCQVCHPKTKLKEDAPKPHLPKHLIHLDINIGCVQCHDDLVHHVRKGRAYRPFEACTSCHQATSQKLSFCQKCHLRFR